MVKRIILVVACAAAFSWAPGCKKAGEGPAPTAKTATPAATAPKNDAPMVAPAPPPANTCYSSCMRQYSMRAVSADQNDKDCRTRCQTECIDPCLQRSAMRAVSKEQILSDCRRSCGL